MSIVFPNAWSQRLHCWLPLVGGTSASEHTLDAPDALGSWFVQSDAHFSGCKSNKLLKKSNYTSELWNGKDKSAFIFINTNENRAMCIMKRIPLESEKIGKSER